jgi:hypothetical protein
MHYGIGGYFGTRNVYARSKLHARRIPSHPTLCHFKVKLCVCVCVVATLRVRLVRNLTAATQMPTVDRTERDVSEIMSEKDFCFI